MYIIINIFIIIAAVCSYFGLRISLNDKLNENYIILIWCGIFTVINIIRGAVTLHMPIMGDYSFIVSVIIAFILTIVYACYCNYKAGAKSENMYCLITRPIAYELVFNGLLLPILYTFIPLAVMFSVSVLYFNGASCVVSLLQVAFGCLDSKKIGNAVGFIGLNFVICLFHALITIQTGSVLIPIFLRLCYGGIFWKLRSKY